MVFTYSLVLPDVLRTKSRKYSLGAGILSGLLGHLGSFFRLNVALIAAASVNSQASISSIGTTIKRQAIGQGAKAASIVLIIFATLLPSESCIRIRTEHPF